MVNTDPEHGGTAPECLHDTDEARDNNLDPHDHLRAEPGYGSVRLYGSVQSYPFSLGEAGSRGCTRARHVRHIKARKRRAGATSVAVLDSPSLTLTLSPILKF